MKRNHKLIVGIGASISLGLAALAVSAHPGQMGAGTERGAMHQSAKGAMGHGGAGHGGMGHSGTEHGGMRHGGMKHGTAGHDGATPQAAQQLLTPDERTAMREKMRAAKTPEERQQIALANRAEMEKRAKDKGITLPEPRGHRGRHGAGPAAATTPPAAEHVH